MLNDYFLIFNIQKLKRHFSLSMNFSENQNGTLGNLACICTPFTINYFFLIVSYLRTKLADLSLSRLANGNNVFTYSCDKNVYMHKTRYFMLTLLYDLVSNIDIINNIRNNTNKYKYMGHFKKKKWLFLSTYVKKIF